MSVFYLLRSCLASRARSSPRKTSAPGRYSPTRLRPAAGRGAGRWPRRRRLTFDTATATSFLLHFYIIVAHPSRSSAPVRTLISSLYFDKSRDGPVLLRVDGELTACFFGENYGVSRVRGARGPARLFVAASSITLHADLVRGELGTHGSGRVIIRVGFVD